MAKQNGHTNGTAAKRNGHLSAKPRRPRGQQSNFRTAEEAAPFREYMKQLRAWLDVLSDEEHEQAVKKLTSAELAYITAAETYENYQKGGVLREILEGTCFEGTL